MYYFTWSLYYTEITVTSEEPPGGTGLGVGVILAIVIVPLAVIVLVVAIIISIYLILKGKIIIRLKMFTNMR